MNGTKLAAGLEIVWRFSADFGPGWPVPACKKNQ